MASPTQIHGLTYLLARDDRGVEWVSRYDEYELEEVFTAEQLRELQSGATVVQRAGPSVVAWQDMVAATRAARLRGAA